METFWKVFQFRYLLVFLLSMVADFVAAVHVYALSQDRLATTLVAGALMPFVNYLGDVWFIDSKTNTERLALTTCSSLGILVGTAATLLIFGKD